MKKLGISALKQGLSAMIELAEKIKECAADGKITLWEKLGLLGQGSSFIEAVANAKQIKDEYLDLDSSERAELVQFVRDNYNFDDERVEAIVEESFNVALGLDGLVRALKNN